MSNRDIALNWQGLPLPVSRQFAVCLTDLLNTHHPTWLQARAVTMNFRDPGYGPESGGFHPVEIRLQRQGNLWSLVYITDFSYVGMGDYAELTKEVDFDFSSQEGLVAYAHVMPLSELGEFYELWEGNFLTYLSLGVYAITVATE
ncbi:hypothetical protein CF141_01305 [Aeromonas hydrophila]|uniref:DUF2787 family protein n=1 Tax=Aeromonas hydrophila TaxID=644 RepID=UPI001115F291|nr:DUF2787 family protein [Aeromonas hydrophila]TNH78859.1 hypothetical protein CF141_01305 [Aeromonas hydrophila]